MLARPFALPLLALLAACPSPSDKEPGDTSGQETGIPSDDDRDDDGYDAAVDCDEDNPHVHPNADEVCDDVDNDCDDLIDEGVSFTFYLDEDQDGYGTDAGTVEACDAPEGYAALDTDCDDASASVYPGADETCNGFDDDCDGETDEDDAIDPTTVYLDMDGDGYGRDDSPYTGCAVPDGYAPYGGDCDDEDPLYHPGAEETDCEDPNDYNCDGSTGYADADADGFAACAECDDGDAGHYPGAVELCDDVDDDCDGEIDESDALDASTWYADADADGYGDADATTLACDPPDGYADNPDDCDDGEPETFPGADETCDGEDDDCDGETDEDDAVDALSWYADADLDGYGDPDALSYACAQPAGSVDDDTDCDDGSASTNPGADETCDGEDDDCDGVTDEDEAVDAGSWYTDADDDGYGEEGDPTVSCEAPAGTVGDATDCDDADPSVNPGADERCDEVDDDCDGETDEDDAVDAGTWYADADLDGFGDPATAAAACEQPDGYVDNAYDCDDDDDQSRPDATEVCDGDDDDCDGETDEDDAVDADTWYADADDDGHGDATASAAACDAPTGHVASADDCDDADATVYPGADETCDDVDDDCDGEVDEDATDAARYYLDEDNDRYGQDDAIVRACARPSGYRARGGDCDDADDSVNPGASERCDGVDQDCDGTTDEGAVDAPTWYADADEDGYGDPAESAASCEAPEGWLADARDCDDADAGVHPGADETCDDADQDCDGEIDEDAIDLLSWTPDADGDGYGGDGPTVEACSAPADHAAEGGDCDDADGDVNPGAAEVCQNGVDDDCDGGSDPCALSGDASVSASDAVLLGESAGDKAGTAVAGAGDVDGDGRMDLIIGASGSDRRSTSAGAAYVVLGAPSGTVSLADADAILVGEAASDAAGEAVSGGGDVDGDGYDDVLVGAKGYDGGGSSAGAAWLVSGPVAGTLSLSAADTTLLGEDASDYAGASLDLAGDLDGGGLAWIAVGARNHTTGGVKGGATYLVASPAAGDLDLSTADAVIVGTTAYDYAATPAGAGDLDGDGVGDLLVGAEGVDVEGSACGGAYLFLGPISGALSLADADGARYGVEYGDAAGSALDGIGDSDGDGYAETVIGAYKADNGTTRDAGAAYVFSGDWSGTGLVSEADAIRYGEAKSDAAAVSVAGAGDTDGDGLADLLVGAWYNDDGGTDAGGAWLVLGPLSGAASLSEADASWAGAASTDYAGYAVAGPGDTDGDGKADLLVGAYYNDDAGTNAGAVYLVFGTGL